MKKIITLLLALGLGFSVMVPVTSEARDHRHSYRQTSYSHSCGYCGGPVYRQQVVVGYRYGHPIYSWRPAPHVHRSYDRHRHHHHGHGHHDRSRGRVSYPGFYFGFGR